MRCKHERSLKILLIKVRLGLYQTFNFAAEFLTAYIIISVYWSSPVFIQLAFVVLCKVTENQQLDRLNKNYRSIDLDIVKQIILQDMTTTKNKQK